VIFALATGCLRQTLLLVNPPTPAPVDLTRIQHRRERLMMLPFACDLRASLPRPLHSALMTNASLAGVPPTLRDRVGENICSTAFPYPQFLQSSGELAYTELDIVELENASWRVAICPNLGGRVLQVYDRHRQRDLLFQPAALNQAVVGLAGAWFIGGVEFNGFRYGHNIHGLSAVESRQARLHDGMPAVELEAFDELFECSWRVIIALGVAQVFFRIELTNHSAEPQPGYWWTNIAVPTHRQTRIMCCPGPMLHHGMFRVGYQHDFWPTLHGQDWSRWPNHHEIISGYLYENRSDFVGYADGVAGFAFVHQADHSICRGRKLWSIGANRDHTIWSDRLLEPASTSYIELQSGLYPLQVGCGQLQPGERRAWTESLGAIDWEPTEDASQGDYHVLFDRFEQLAAERMRAEFLMRNSTEAWLAAEGAPLTAASPRVNLSKRVTLDPRRVTSAEVTRTVEQGWVAGAAWRRKLEELVAKNELSRPGQLALAAAMMDAGQIDGCLGRLQLLADADDPTAGWAAYLLGLYSADWHWLERAIARLPDRAEIWLALDSALAHQQRHEERAQLWHRAPRPLMARDDVRVAQAVGALARCEWDRVRMLLQAPLLAIAEGSITPWLIYRESYVAEAMTLWCDGNDENASRLFFLGGQSASQFGVGRDEAGWGQDMIYYRWRLAQERGRSVEAALLLGMSMRHEPYAGSISAAYLARLAIEAAHPSANKRIEALQRWDDQSGEGASVFTPLRAALVETLTSGAATRWSKLRNDPLYLHRAAFECSLSSRRPAVPAGFCRT